MSANKKKNTGPSIRKDETSEEETDDTGSEEEDEHEFNKKEFKTKGDFLLSLQSVTREQFLDKKSFARVIEEGQSRIRSRRERKHLTIEMFKWKDNTLKYRQSGRWTTLEYVNTKRKHNIKDSTKRRNQREEEGMTTRQIWEWMREENPPRGTYVGETFAVIVGARDGHFQRRQSRPSALTLHLQETGERWGVIITDSEDERKDLEKFIIQYLTQQEEENCSMTMINKKTHFHIDPELRARARNLVHAGIPLTRFEETGAIDVVNRYELNYICTPENFVEKIMLV